MQSGWVIEDNPLEIDLAVIRNGVFDWGRSQAVGGNPLPIACFLREREAVVAGACGRTEFSRLFVTHLWVLEEKRNKGIGTQALEWLESAAKERGARDSLIETLDERASCLYRRLGYVEIAMIPAYVGRFDRHVMLKGL
jgi:GNAT superfamily N-acetyltransferase